MAKIPLIDLKVIWSNAFLPSDKEKLKHPKFRTSLKVAVLCTVAGALSQVGSQRLQHLPKIAALLLVARSTWLKLLQRRSKFRQLSSRPSQKLTKRFWSRRGLNGLKWPRLTLKVSFVKDRININQKDIIRIKWKYKSMIIENDRNLIRNLANQKRTKHTLEELNWPEKVQTSKYKMFDIVF